MYPVVGGRAYQERCLYTQFKHLPPLALKLSPVRPLHALSKVLSLCRGALVWNVGIW